jgi:hypothetical protein
MTVSSWRNVAPPATAGFLVLATLGLTCLGTVPAAGQNTEQEKALRTRVEEFYSLLQSGRAAQAESYLTQDSLEDFRNQSKNPFVKFQIDTIKMDPDGQGASVLVRLRFPTGMPPRLVEAPRTTRWRLENGVWRAAIPKPDPNVLQSLFSATSGIGSSAQPPPPEELKFKGHRYNLGEIPPGQVKQARFPFTNVTDHVVTLAAVLTGCKCLQVKTEKKVYKPGESGEVVIEFDAAGYEHNYEQTIVVKTDPGSLTTYLTIAGYVVPRPRDGPKAEQRPKGF